jgi:hypothetical protein
VRKKMSAKRRKIQHLSDRRRRARYRHSSTQGVSEEKLMRDCVKSPIGERLRRAGAHDRYTALRGGTDDVPTVITPG